MALHTLLSTIIDKHPDLFDKAFGKMLATVLQNKLKSSPAQMLDFARTKPAGMSAFQIA